MKFFRGKVIHSSQYHFPEEFSNKRVAIIGEGNSGAQILAEVSQVAETLWITKKSPAFLPDHVDGRYLFDAATKMYEAKLQGKEYKPPSLADIVMVAPVKNARESGVFNNSRRPFDRFSLEGLVWADGHEEKVDAVIFCTGFKASLNHLATLKILTAEGNARTIETKAMAVKGLWLVGYGNWTGFASATLIGVGRSARKTVEEIKEYLKG
jgi:cation diffusion facilitator CzcD-associated flavoprotein CzcO